MPLSLAYSSVLLALLSGAVALLAEFHTRHGRPAPTGRKTGSGSQRLIFGLLTLSGAAALAGGILALLGPEIFHDQLPFGLPWMRWQVRLDALSGFFLATIGAGVIAVSFFGPGYVLEYRSHQRPMWLLGLCTGLFIAGMELVLVALGGCSSMDVISILKKKQQILSIKLKLMVVE